MSDFCTRCNTKLETTYVPNLVYDIQNDEWIETEHPWCIECKYIKHPAFIPYIKEIGPHDNPPAHLMKSSITGMIFDNHCKHIAPPQYVTINIGSVVNNPSSNIVTSIRYSA